MAELGPSDENTVTTTNDTFRYDRDRIVAFEGFKGKKGSESVVKGDFSRGIEEDVLEGLEVCW